MIGAAHDAAQTVFAGAPAAGVAAAVAAAADSGVTRLREDISAQTAAAARRARDGAVATIAALFGAAPQPSRSRARSSGSSSSSSDDDGA
jgi:hypothetical protein